MMYNLRVKQYVPIPDRFQIHFTDTNHTNALRAHDNLNLNATPSNSRGEELMFKAFTINSIHSMADIRATPAIQSTLRRAQSHQPTAAAATGSPPGTL